MYGVILEMLFVLVYEGSSSKMVFHTCTPTASCSISGEKEEECGSSIIPRGSQRDDNSRSKPHHVVVIGLTE